MGLPAAQNGLAERRVMKDFADNHLPTLVQELRELAGFDIEVEVDYEALHCQGADSSYWIENFRRVYFEPTYAALKAVCTDDMGREALKAKVKSFHITNSDGRYKNFCRLEGDKFVFDHSPDSNVDYVQERVKELQSFLEDNL